MPLPDEQDRNVRGSIADVARRLNKAQASLEDVVVSLDHDDPEGARFALDEAESQIEAAGKEARTTNHALRAARDREAP
jgi:hypothetical protein